MRGKCEEQVNKGRKFKKDVVPLLSDAGGSRRLKVLGERLRRIDDELVEIERELAAGKDVKSSVVEEDLEGEREMLFRMDVEAVSEMLRKEFFVRCRRCESEFKHQADVKPIEVGVKCPVCNESHVIRVKPVSRYHSVVFPDTLDVLERVRRKKK